ncbi:hypothetical protein [Clostridium perfringens]|uniref:hypothetical protein n=1 Tax=Clostridium perfringens TaxID=1502 RepID=UPI0032D9BA40
MNNRIYPRKNFEDQKYFRDCFSKFLILKINEALEKENPTNYMCRDNFIMFYDTLNFYNAEYISREDKLEIIFHKNTSDINTTKSPNFRSYLKLKALSLGLDLDDLIDEFKKSYKFKNSKNSSTYDAGLEQEILKFKLFNPKTINIDLIEIYSSYIFNLGIPHSKRKVITIESSKLKQTLEIDNRKIYVYNSNGTLGFFKLENNKFEVYYPPKILKEHLNEFNIALESTITIK